MNNPDYITPEDFRFSVFNAKAVRHPARWKMWWHRFVSLGRRRTTLEVGISVTWYRTRKNVSVILDSYTTEDADPALQLLDQRIRLAERETRRYRIFFVTLLILYWLSRSPS